jgi:hypothetical protein
MDLINRYAHEVGQYLPHRLRADVEAELRSLLTDSVEERARAEGVPADDALAGTVLREFGTPKDVAARYAPEPQYLIGPRLYPVYVVAVKVMLPVLAADPVGGLRPGGRQRAHPAVDRHRPARVPLRPGDQVRSRVVRRVHGDQSVCEAVLPAAAPAGRSVGDGVARGLDFASRRRRL